MGIYDVPAAMLISEMAKDLKTKAKKPAFTDFVKTGQDKQRTPDDKDWFYTRMASILYRVYKFGNTGTGSLRSYYGGRKKRGVKPEKKRKASGKVIRVCLQELEKLGFIAKEKKGRKVSGKGEKFMYETAKILETIFNEARKKEKDSVKEANEQRAKRRAEAKKAEEQKAETQNVGTNQKPAKPEQKHDAKTQAGDKHGRRPEGKKA